MKLGLDSYTLRWQGWDARQLVEHCGAIGVDSVQLSGGRHFESLAPEHLLPIKRLGDELGVQIELGAGCIDKHSSAFNAARGTGEEWLTAVLKGAALVGSPSVHVVLGGPAERVGPVPLRQHMEECVRVAKAVAPVARDLGIKLAFENHGDLLAREMKWLVEEAGTDDVGCCLDTGNPVSAAEDPLLTVELLAPYTVTSHIRDNRVWPAPGGAMIQGVPMGQGSLDWPRMVGILREQAPDMVFSLEVLTGREPRLLPYFEPGSSFWEPYPDMLARDFARFVALAERGKPEPYEMVTGQGAPGWTRPEGENADALVAQQLRHWEESVRYCKEELGLGEKR
jgi:sugar phosphate isomerase/epimerase